MSGTQETVVKLNLMFVRKVSCCCCLHHKMLVNYIVDVCVGWIVRNGICYKKFDYELTVDEALSLCEDNNAYLAEIPNIYVDNIITEIVGEGGGECWTGLRTNDTHYYWRSGEFPLGEDMPSNMNYCGSVNDNNGYRWHLHNCYVMIPAICMIGKETNTYNNPL